MSEAHKALLARLREIIEETPEALVGDAAAPWSSLFTEADPTAARARLRAMQQAHERAADAAEAVAVEHNREIVALANKRRIERGKPALTPEQEAG